MHYPGDYGFIPGMLAWLMMATLWISLFWWMSPSFTGCLMEARPVGVLRMQDGNEHDEKILAIPTCNPRFENIHTMDQVFPHARKSNISSRFTKNCKAHR